MKAMFSLGVFLLNRLRYPHKFLLIGTLFLTPLLLLGYLLIQEVNQRIVFMEQQQPGIEYLVQLRNIIRPLQEHRYLAAAVLGGKVELRAKLMQQQTFIDQELVKLQQLDIRFGEQLNTKDLLASLQSDWATLKQELIMYTQVQSFKHHTALVTTMLEYIRHLANTSNLILASEMDTYYLVDMLVHHLPKLAEDLGQSRALGSTVIIRGVFTTDDWEQLLGSSQGIVKAKKELERSLQPILDQNPSLISVLKQPADKMFGVVDSYNARLELMLIEDEVTVSLEGFFNQASFTLDSVFELFDLVAPTLNQLLKKRIKDYQLIRTTTLFIMLSVLLGMVYVFICFYLSIMRSITELRAGIEQIATGDLTTHIVLATQDETHLIAQQANAMAQ
ncbi:MAG: HAMP domain-containing protein [Pseudomonadaceae bacterium]|nr:HAMP domain-containing protein [Pseudomonadaceae bacterium]